MADPKGTETGQGAKGGVSARPRAQTLDLPARDVSPAKDVPWAKDVPLAKDVPPAKSDAPTPAGGPVTGASAASMGPAQPSPTAGPSSPSVTGSKPGGPVTPPAESPKPSASAAITPDPAKPATTAAPQAPKSGGASSETPRPATAATAKPATSGPASTPGASAAAPQSSRAGAIPQRRSDGVGVLGVLAAAIGGAAIAVLVIALFGKELLGLREPDMTRVTAAEAKLDVVGRDVAALHGQLAKTAQATDTSAIDARLSEISKSIEGSNGRVGGVETELKALSDRMAAPPAADPAIAILAGRIDGLELRLQNAPTADALAVLGGRLAGVEARVGDLPTRDSVEEVALSVAAIGTAVEGVGPKITQATAPLGKRVDEIAAALQARPKGDPAARLVVALGALDQALAAGRPFVAELTAVKAAAGGNAELSALDASAANGLPTRTALGAELSEIIGKLPPVKPAQQPASVFDRFVANAGGVVKITPKDAAGGSDPASVRASVAATAASGDVEGALSGRGTLDEAARAATDAWSQTATTRIAAETAVGGARTAALARLSAND